MDSGSGLATAWRPTAARRGCLPTIFSIPWLGNDHITILSIDMNARKCGVWMYKEEVHFTNEALQIYVVHDRWHFKEFRASFLPIEFKATRIATLPVNQRRSSLNNTFIERCIRFLCDTPAFFPTLVRFPKAPSVEQFDALMIVLSTFRIQTCLDRFDNSFDYQRCASSGAPLNRQLLSTGRCHRSYWRHWYSHDWRGS